MNTSVMKEFTFAAGHRLPNHKGKCRRLHGHTYTARIFVRATLNTTSGASSEGMVVDFDVIKQAWAPIDTELDHRFLLSYEDPLLSMLLGDEPESVVVFPGPPTAEAIAAWIYGRMIVTLPDLEAVMIYESPTSFAEVCGE